jgi:hypothetical protein
MESANIVHQLLRRAYLGADPDTLPVSTLDQRQSANGVHQTGGTPWQR